MKDGSLKNVFVINFLFAFMSAAVVMLLPLYMIDKQFSLENIGLILAAMPVTFLIFRLIFSTLGDQLGTRVIFFINAVTTTVGIFIYWVSASPLAFVAGRLTDGIKESSFWAVNRTEAYRASEKKNLELNAVNMVGIRGIGFTLGRFVAGAMLLFISFQNAFLALGILSLVLFYFAGKTSKNGTVKLDFPDLLKRLTKPRTSDFWLATIPLTIYGIVDFTLFVFTLPVYMDVFLGMGYLEIGLIIGWAMLIYSISIFVMTKLKFGMKNLALITMLLLGIPIILIPFVDVMSFLVLLSLFGFGLGAANVIYEKIVVWATGRSKDTSTEIGVLHAPLRIGEMVSMALIGFIISAFGFVAAFLLSGVFIFLYGAVSIILSRKMQKTGFL